MDAAELDRDAPPGGVGAPFGDADEDQGEPSQQHVGADATLEAVEHGAQLEGGLEVPEPAFGLEEVLVAQRDVLSAQIGIAGGQQVLAVEALHGPDLRAVDDEAAAGGLAEV